MVLDLTDTTWLQYVEENDRIRAMLNEWSSRTAKVYVYKDMETSFLVHVHKHALERSFFPEVIAFSFIFILCDD